MALLGIEEHEGQQNKILREVTAQTSPASNKAQAAMIPGGSVTIYKVT